MNRLLRPQEVALYLAIFVYPALTLTARGGVNAAMAIIALISMGMILMSGKKIREYFEGQEVRLFMLAMSSGAIAILINQAYYQRFDPRPLDAELRFLLAIIIFAALRHSTLRLAIVLEHAFPIGVLASLLGLNFGVTPWTRANTGFLDSIHVGEILTVLAFLSLFSVNWLKRDALYLLLLKLSGFFVGIYLAIQTGSRGAWAVIPLLLFIWYMTLKPRPVSIRAAFAIIITLCVISYLSSSVVQRRVDLALSNLNAYAENQINNGTAARLELWRVSFHLLKTNPIVGIEPGSLPKELVQLNNASEINEKVLQEGLAEMHSEVAARMAKYGGLGLLSALAVCALPLWLFSRSTSSANRVEKGAARMGIVVTLSFLVFGLTVEVFNIKMVAAFYSLTVAALLAAMTIKCEIASAKNNNPSYPLIKKLYSAHSFTEIMEKLRSFKKEITLAGQILAIATLIHFAYLITNQHIATGDGLRILPYIEAIQTSGNTVPLWNPYKLMGIPTLAEAERFIWLAPIIPIDSNYRMLLLNLANVGALVLLSISGYLFAKSFKLSTVPALFFALTITFSQLIANHVKSGNINQYFDYALILALAPFFYQLCQNRNRLLLRLLVAASMGYALSSSAYYALASTFPVVMLYALFRLEGDWKSKAKKVFFEAFLCTLLGAAIFFPLLLPLIESSMSSIVGQLPHTTLMQAQPYPYSIVNLMFPFDLQYKGGLFGGGSFDFISLLMLPLLAVFLQNRQRIMAQHRDALYLAFALVIVGLPFVLGQIFPFSEVVNLFSHTPILRSIRWNIPFQWLMLVGVSLFMAVVLQQMVRKEFEYAPSKGWGVLLIAMLSAFLMGLLAFTFDRLGLSSYTPFIFLLDIKALDTELLLWVLAVIAVLLLTKRWILHGMAVLFLSQLILIQPYDEMPRVKSQALTKEYARILNNDHSYFYFHSYRISRLRIPTVRKIYEFSTFLPTELGTFLSSLYNTPVTTTRPHWIKPPELETWNHKAANLAGVKYIQLPKPFSPDALENWQVVTETDWDALLQNKSWQSPVRLIPSWEVEPSPKSALDKALAQNQVFDKVWLNVDPVFPKMTDQSNDRQCSKAESVTYRQTNSDSSEVEIWACANKVLFIPELYHKDVEVTVNGEHVELLRANGSFRGIAISAGQSTVVLRYHPLKFYWAVWGAFTIVMAMLTFALYRRLNAKRQINNPT